VLGKEDLKSVKFLWDTLDVIETVNTDNKLDTLELLFKGRYPLLYLGLLETLVEFFGVDTDRESADSNNFALELNPIRRCRKSPRVVSNCILCSRRKTYNMREQLLKKWRA
jgi:hypothetical protein